MLEGDPYQVLESNFLRMQQRKPVVQTKIKNLRTSKIVERNFQPSDTFEEAELIKKPLRLLYKHRGEYVFVDPEDPKNRFSLSEETVGENKKWLKDNTEVTALFLKDKFLNLTLPIKMDFRVVEAPPGIQGERAQAGTKTVKIETGAAVQVPLFINTGDIIRINTETGEYTERVEKA